MEIVKINIGIKDDFHDGVILGELYPKRMMMFPFPSLKTPPPTPVPADSIQFIKIPYPEIIKPVMKARFKKHGDYWY